MHASSPRRVAANRSNASKSTGPRTPAGKARAALNALKHGCAARTPRLPGEDAAAIAAFVGDLVDELAPATPFERELAERVAGLSWRRRRVAAAERELFRRHVLDEDSLDAPFDHPDDCPHGEAEEMMADQFAGRRDGALLRLAEHDRRLCGSIDAAFKLLMKLQAIRAMREAAEAEAAAAEDYDDRPARNDPVSGGGDESGEVRETPGEQARETPWEAYLDALSAPVSSRPRATAAPAQNEPISGERDEREQVRETPWEAYLSAPSAPASSAPADAPAQNEPNGGLGNAPADARTRPPQTNPTPQAPEPPAPPDTATGRAQDEPSGDATGGESPVADASESIAPATDAVSDREPAEPPAAGESADLPLPQHAPARNEPNETADPPRAASATPPEG